MTAPASAPSDLELSRSRSKVLWLSTAAFTLLFAVWLMLGVLGVPMQKEMNATGVNLSDSQLEWLVAAAIFSGALLRLNFGIWADRFGGRNVMVALLLFTAIPTYLFSHATSYPMLLLCAALFGLAGNSFTVGIAWNSAWFPDKSKGTALGVFGAGNVGASGTKLLVIFVPTVLTLVPASGYLGGLIPGGWRAIPVFYSGLLILMAGIIYWLAPTNDPLPAKGRSMKELLQPLKHMQVWRFSLYYVVVFGAYVALSGWLPKFYMKTYDIPLTTAALYTASFIFPASLLRPFGGFLSDKFGPRVVTYAVFCVMASALAVLSIPYGTYLGIEYHPGAGAFAMLMFVVGCGMGIGKASVYKYIPNYFPKDVGAVGGLVGMLGALGGFFLPPLFGFLGRTSGIPQLAFLSLLGLTVGSLIWLHISVMRIRATKQRELTAGASNPGLSPSLEPEVAT